MAKQKKLCYTFLLYRLIGIKNKKSRKSKLKKGVGSFLMELEDKRQYRY